MELFTAFAILCAIVVLQVNFALSAGALWRDEAGIVNHATLENLNELWSNLDKYPILSALILRLWAATDWGATDIGLRVFGLIAGTLVLAALWLNSKIFGHNVPLVAMVLIGLNAAFIKLFGSVRPYGLGILFTTISFGAFWLAASAPTAWRIIIAVISGVLMVQCVYTNVFLLLGIGSAAIVVCVVNRHYTRSILIGLLVLLIALTLWPYVSIMERLADWVQIQRAPDITLVTSAGLMEALGEPNKGLMLIWAAILTAFVFAAIRLSRESQGLRAPTEPSVHDVVVFSTVALCVSTITYVVFFETAVKMPLSARHVLPLLAFTAICTDVVVGKWRNGVALRITLALIVALGFGMATWQKVSERITTVDIVAKVVKEHAHNDDMVILYPWYLGITFDRYYRGNTPWTTIPPMNDHKLHRWDLIKRSMLDPDPIKGTLETIKDTLDKGRTVWVIGEMVIPTPHLHIPSLPAPPHPKSGWSCLPYLHHWGLRTFDLLFKSATYRKQIHVDLHQPTNIDESPLILLFRARDAATFFNQ